MGVVEPVRRELASSSRGERRILVAIMGLALLVVWFYILARRPLPVRADEIEYHDYGALFAEGHLWWRTDPFGVEYASAFRPPVYPAWVGIWYAVFGVDTTAVLFVQSLLAPVTVFLGWLLARRLFDARVAIAAAAVIAAFPFIWEYFGLLYSEALAIPLTVIVLYLFLEREPTTPRAIGVGAALGVLLLIRPTSAFLVAGIAAAWVIAAGWRVGVARTVVCVVAAALVVLPWTIRNYVVTDGFIPISMQDMAPGGVFNEEAANDPVRPYAWRLEPEPEPEIITRMREEGRWVGDVEFRSGLLDYAWEYIQEHPFSIVEAFYWNGLTRFWDVRSPARALDDPPLEGRPKGLAAVGLAMYYVLLLAALVGLWRLRRRSSLFWPLVAIAVAASIVFTTAAFTRYRATLEPLIVIVACSNLARRPVPEPQPMPRTTETVAAT
jgi:4-amino-4-deoxy-L-arabinose transferase-like glycosyltransferase